MTQHTQGPIVELIMTKEGEKPVFRFLYAWGNDPIDFVVQMYIDRGYTVNRQDYDVPHTERGYTDLAFWLEAFAYRFHDAAIAKAEGR